MLLDAFESQETRNLKRLLPGENGLPFLGHSLEFLYRPVETALRYEQKFGSAFWLEAFGLTGAVLVGPEANKLVLLDREKAFSNSKGWDFFIGRFFERGIMLLDFEEHRHHRRIMQNAFKKPVLVEYLNEMDDPIQNGIQRWLPQDDFHVFTAIKKLTLDMATEIFMGHHLGPEANKLNKAFIDTVRAGTSLIRFPVPGGRWKKGLDGRKVLYKFFKSKINEKRHSSANDLFSQLCRAETEDGDRFTDDDVINHMIFLMMAAHDTSTITLCSVFYNLAKYPEWQQRLRGDSLALQKHFIQHEDLATLSRADLVMKESLRLVSPVHGIPRMTVKDVEFQGTVIPAGTFVITSPYVTHHMEEWWNEPEKFDPERFSPERNEHKKHPYQYVPFGGGAHKCIGLHFAELQVKAIMHQVLQQFEWSVSEDYTMPINFTTLPIPKDGLPVTLKRV